MTTQKPAVTSRIAQASRHSLLLLASFLTLLLAVIAIPRSFALEPVTTPPAAKTSQTAPKATQPQTASVNINTADAAALAATLVGVGPAKAEAIIAYRTEKGKFTSIDQLLEVKGIGKATLEKNRAKITL